MKSTLLQRETPEFIPQRRGHPIRQIWIRWITASGVYRSRIHDVKELKNVCWPGWRLLDHSSRHRGCDCALRSGAVVWAHAFVWLVDILSISFERLTLWSVCFRFIDTCFCKLDRHKHVQSVYNIRANQPASPNPKYSLKVTDHVSKSVYTTEKYYWIK